MKFNFIKTTVLTAMLALCGATLNAQTPCATAPTLLCNSVVNGTTVGGWPAGGNITAPAVWYKFVGNNQVVTATISNSSYDNRLTVYRPSGGSTTCNSFNHIGTNDNGVNSSTSNRDAEISWYAQTGITYYVIVHGTAAATGTYSLNFNCIGSTAPSNNACSGARDFNLCVTDYNLTTQNATNDVVNGTTYNAGVWFKMTGFVGNQVLTTCDGTWFDNIVNIWEVNAGSGCPTTTNPIFTNDDYCLTQSLVQFTASSAKDYYILLSGYGSGKGGYDIRLCGTPKTDFDESIESKLDGAKIIASPNPANDQVRFEFAVKQAGVVTVQLYNLAGQEVATVRSSALEAGMSASTDLNVSSLPTGMYVYRAQIDGVLHTGKVQVAH
jgi:hypothetical protein